VLLDVMTPFVNRQYPELNIVEVTSENDSTNPITLDLGHFQAAVVSVTAAGKVT
jgi:hypothetical protein